MPATGSPAVSRRRARRPSSSGGRITDGTKEVRTLARLNGKPAVVLEVQRQSGENTVAVIEGVKELLPRCRDLLPDDVQVSVVLEAAPLAQEVR